MRAIAVIAIGSVVTMAASAPAQQEETLTPATTQAPDSERTPDEDFEPLTVPGEPHEVLADTVGEWDLTIRVWSTPEGEPTETRGTASGHWILGERFVETTYKGEVMGRAFEGLKIEGYENAAEEYVSTWRDNLGTYTLVFRGRCDDPCSVRTMIADFLDPVSDQKLKVKGVTTISETDSYLYESFIVTPDGREFKNMELAAERRQP